ncbi:MAG: hypothetical protein ACTSRW_11395 [Candidatus Helarchaeota archaeon]
MEKKINPEDTTDLFKMIEIVDKKKPQPLEEIVLKLRKENKELTTELQEKAKRLKEYKAELKELEKTNKKQLETIYDLIRFVDELKKERETLLGEQCKEEIKEEQKKSVISQKIERSDDPEAVMRLLDKIDEQSREIPSVENISGKLGNQIFELKKKLKKVETEKEKTEQALNEYIKKLQEDIEKLEVDRTKLVDNFNDQIKTMQQEVKELEETRTKHENYLKTYEEQLKNNEIEIKDLKKQLKEATKK